MRFYLIKLVEIIYIILIGCILKRNEILGVLLKEILK